MSALTVLAFAQVAFAKISVEFYPESGSSNFYLFARCSEFPEFEYDAESEYATLQDALRAFCACVQTSLDSQSEYDRELSASDYIVYGYSSDGEVVARSGDDIFEPSDRRVAPAKRFPSPDC